MKTALFSMNRTFHWLKQPAIQLAAWGLLVSSLASALADTSNLPGPATAVARPRPDGGTNTAPAFAPIPPSLFVMPTRPQEGRDPFFPHSTRPYGTGVILETNQAPVAAAPVELRLKGFSGPTDHRLAIINNQTFAVGEVGEVSTTTGRLRIRCVKINDDSVVIQVGNETRVLRLRSGL